MAFLATRGFGSGNVSLLVTRGFVSPPPAPTPGAAGGGGGIAFSRASIEEAAKRLLALLYRGRNKDKVKEKLKKAIAKEMDYGFGFESAVHQAVMATFGKPMDAGDLHDIVTEVREKDRRAVAIRMRQLKDDKDIIAIMELM